MSDLTKEQIVLKNMEKAAKSPLRFGVMDMYYFPQSQVSLEEEIKELKQKTTLYDRIHLILWIAGRYGTYDEHNRKQCHGGARRSLFDIKRIYEYYFGEVNVFDIMRVLYQLAVKEKKIYTMSCWTTQKLVFWTHRNDGGTERRITAKREVGVPVKDWENIGLTEVQ